MFTRLRSLFRAITGRRRFEDGMNEELHFHIEQYVNDLVRSGLSRQTAERRARLEFGSLNQVKGECRESRGLYLFDELRRELHYAARLLRKTPGFTATALATLALCLGANLTIFGVIDAVLLRPLPFPHPDRLASIFNTYPKAGVPRDGSSFTNYYERRGRIPAFTSLSLYRPGTVIVGETGSTERDEMMQVSPEFFSTLGRGPVLGRAFTEAETTYRTDGVVILTDAYWRQRLNSDRHVIGRSIRANDIPVTVVGVLPPDFRFLSSEALLFFPLSSSPEQRGPRERHSGGNVIQMIGRLKPGATIAQAQSQIDAQNATLEINDPKAKMMAEAGFRSVVLSLHADHVSSTRPTLLLLQAGALLLLIVGAVNLANLLLVRANTRVKESAVRQALGAGRAHIISEAIIETTLLILAGAVLGIGVGAVGIRLAALLGANRLPLASHLAFDTRVAAAGLLGALFLGLILAAPVAWFQLKGHPGAALSSETRGGTAGRSAQRLRHTFIIAQIALAIVLLSGAGLLGLSLEHAIAVFPGFRSDHLLTGQISLTGRKYPDPASGLAFTERLVKEVELQPGVLAAGVIDNMPFSGNSGKSSAYVKGYVLQPHQLPRGIYSYGVNGNYFEAMQVPLRAGRFLNSDDSRRTERVCVVDEDFARYYWPRESALGQHLFQGSEAGPDTEAFTVVGVVGRVKQAGLTDDEPQGAVYYPYIFRPAATLFVLVRTVLPPESLGLTLQKAARHIDPDLPISGVQSMQTRVADSLLARRSPALLAALFSAIALLLTALGTYGVLSYGVAQRRREIGVRMALGARPDQIRARFFSLALRLLATGTLLGLCGAWLTGRAMQSILFHVP
ncbi:MAG TPA: ADOP family duplicated permease, partial [Bryobacteraceae bacterium]|nr:ADOP family duplicated permease [Bryobacteraceae bacterium]